MNSFSRFCFACCRKDWGGGGGKKRKKIRENGYFPPLPHPTRGRAGYDLFHDYFPLYHKLSKRCAFETMIKNISMRLLSLSLPPLFYFVSRSTCSFFFPSAPGAPILIPEECSAENNSVTVAWQPPPGHGIVGCAGQRGPAIEGYLLELDDGCGGEFRVNWLAFFEETFSFHEKEREKKKKSNRNFGWIFDRLIYIYIYK